MATCETTSDEQRPTLTVQEYLDALKDRLDDRRAQRCRYDFGTHRWLVSWAPADGRKWLARLSAPEHPETIERFGKTRVAAIQAAAKVLRRAIAPIE